MNAGTDSETNKQTNQNKTKQRNKSNAFCSVGRKLLKLIMWIYGSEHGTMIHVSSADNTTDLSGAICAVSANIGRPWSHQRVLFGIFVVSMLIYFDHSVGLLHANSWTGKPVERTWLGHTIALSWGSIFTSARVRQVPWRFENKKRVNLLINPVVDYNRLLPSTLRKQVSYWRSTSTWLIVRTMTSPT